MIKQDNDAGGAAVQEDAAHQVRGVRSSEVNMEARRDCLRTPGWQESWRMIIAAAGPVAPPLEVEKAEQHELVLQRGVEAPAALLARHLRAEADHQLLQQHRRHGRRAAATRRRSK